MPDLEGMNYEVGRVPVDINTDQNANWVSLENYDVCHVHVLCGAMAATANITINKGTDLSETHTTTFAFDEYYVKTDLSAYAGEDTTPSGIFTRVTGAAGTIATGATANQWFVIPVRAADLGEYSAALPYKCIQVDVSDPGNTDIVATFYTFPASGARFIQQIPPTVVGYP